MFFTFIEAELHFVEMFFSVMKNRISFKCYGKVGDA